VRVEYLAGLIPAISDPTSRVGRVLIEPSGPYLDDARNIVVRDFLADTRLDYLLFIDSDVMFTVEHINNIHAFMAAQSGPCVASGAYRTERNGAYVVAGNRVPNGQIILMTLEEFQAITEPDEVDGVGAGFLMIPRVLLEEMREQFGYPCPWFDEPIDEHGVHLGEDYGFCDRVTKLGYPIYLLPDIRLTHVKSVGLTL
jgi:GT2 family glycosyltransferase